MLTALVRAWRSRDWRWLSVPLIGMFAMTMTSGRFSTWVFVAYLVPVGRALRAVSRIQVFMLLIWALVLIVYLRTLLQGSRRHQSLAVFFVLMFIAEDVQWTGTAAFSAAREDARLTALAEKIPAGCEVIYSSAGFGPVAHQPSLDAMSLAFRLNLRTVNGYTGQLPREFADVFHRPGGAGGVSPQPTAQLLQDWMRAHGRDSAGMKFCEVNP
jgi:hypothetical protein